MARDHTISSHLPLPGVPLKPILAPTPSPRPPRPPARRPPKCSASRFHKGSLPHQLSSSPYAHTLQNVPHSHRRRLHRCNRRKSRNRPPPRLPLVCPQMGARDRVGRVEDERRPRLRLPRCRLLCLCLPCRPRRSPRCSPSNFFHAIPLSLLTPRIIAHSFLPPLLQGLCHSRHRLFHHLYYRRHDLRP